MSDKPQRSTGSRRTQSVIAIVLIAVLFGLLTNQMIEFLGLEMAAAWPGLAMALAGTWVGRTYFG